MALRGVYKITGIVDNPVYVKAVVAAFNQEKALVGAFSVITNLRMELFEALADTGGHHSGPLSHVKLEIDDILTAPNI